VIAVRFEERVRLAAFDELRRRQQVHGEVLSLDALRPPLEVAGQAFSLISHMRGIHKPQGLGAALSIVTTAPKKNAASPYDDRFDATGAFRYHYRDAGKNTAAAVNMAEADNESLRAALIYRLPIIYYVGVVPGRYLPFYPTFVVGDHPDVREFTLDLTGLGTSVLSDPGEMTDSASEGLGREYRSYFIKARLHQAKFREKVMVAYQNQCAVCRLKRPELVEAAHIIPDSQGGEADVRNGMAMCKLHHSAFDQNLLGVRPDLTLAVRRDLLEEIDGPMLAHGLKAFHDRPLMVQPSKLQEKPSPSFLKARWEQFIARQGPLTI
jgi:putative restriction endonuclease